MRIKNWDKFQSARKDRNGAPWIKLYRCTLRSPTWHQMVDHERGQFLTLLMLSDNLGEVSTDDPVVLARMGGMSNSLDLQRFIDLGLVEVDEWLPGRRQNDSLEIEVEVDIEVDIDKKDSPPLKRRGPSLCPENWTPSESDLKWATSKGFLGSQIESAAESMMFWSRGNGKKRTNWSLVWRNWLKREGAGSKVGLTSDENSAAKWSKIREQSRQIDFGGRREHSDDAHAIVSGDDKTSSRKPDRLISAARLDNDGEVD